MKKEIPRSIAMLVITMLVIILAVLVFIAVNPGIGTDPDDTKEQTTEAVDRAKTPIDISDSTEIIEGVEEKISGESAPQEERENIDQGPKTMDTESFVETKATETIMEPIEEVTECVTEETIVIDPSIENMTPLG